MPGRPSSPFLRLPKLWNKRVRSAILHAISQAPVRGRRGQRLGGRADAGDLESPGRKAVWVGVPAPAPSLQKYWGVSDMAAHGGLHQKKRLFSAFPATKPRTWGMLRV